ncbi:MAG: hypothetical protein QXZ11_02445 [Thermoproteota archaeon]
MRREDWKSIFETPFQVRIFNRYIKNWKTIGNLIYAEPNEPWCNYILFQPKPVGLFEIVWNISVFYEAVRKEDMNNTLEEAYRTLKGMECFLEWESSIRRRGVFKENPFLKELCSHINLKISNKLAELLNSDLEVMKLVNKIKPETITISLNSIPATYEKLSESKPSFISITEEFYRKPTSIIWIISLDKMLTQTFSASKKANDIICLFKEILQVIKKLTEDEVKNRVTT